VSTSLASEVDDLWEVFESGRTRPLEWRLSQLDGVGAFLREHSDEIVAATRSDMGKPVFEAFAADVGGVLSELAIVRKHLPRAMAPRRVRTPLRSQPARSALHAEPWGAVLLLPAWNYPIGLSILPLIGALAGGNTVALKPSEVAPASAKLVSARLPDYVDVEAVRVFEGGADVAEELLRHRFAHIHYTGSAAVGRRVMRAAAEHLTPVTLELGGKNPAYVHRDTNLEIAARRIFWGRCFNAGQTCISPDYVLVDEDVADDLVDAMVSWARGAYGDDPRRSPDLARIVDDRHFRRLERLLDGPIDVVFGGRLDAGERYVAPTIVRNVPDDHPLMQDEIFGPILPVVTVAGPEEAIAQIRRRAQPLTMYVFAHDPDVARAVIDETSAGSVVVNQMFTQAANPVLPFGGVGESGMGAYTGIHSFECFSHLKPVARSPIHPDIPIMYPPYRKWKRALIERLMR
jgi:aldehyde dehydrogenase (NAD+)